MKDWGVLLIIGLGLFLLTRKAEAKPDDVQSRFDEYKAQLAAAGTMAEIEAIQNAFLADYHAGALTLSQYNELTQLYAQRQDALWSGPDGLPSLEHMRSCYNQLVSAQPVCSDVDYDRNGVINVLDWSSWASKQRVA